MTKAELLAALAPFPDDARVVIPSWKSGYDDPRVHARWMELDSGIGRLSGRHADASDYWTLDGMTPVVVIGSADDGYIAESDAGAWDAVIGHDNQPEHRAKESR